MRADFAGSKPAKREDAMLDHISTLTHKRDEALKLMDKLQNVAPSHEDFFNRIRAVLK